ncbi:hypothetical protein FRC06_010572, partial [Ceratobasidium sp. 370]
HGSSVSAIAAYESQSGSRDRGDPATTNIFVANLPANIDENSLGMFFARIGPVGSVKIMWPRTDPSHPPPPPGSDISTSARRGMSGFVSYMTRADAEACVRELDGFDWGGSVLRVGWSKAVPIAARPMYEFESRLGAVFDHLCTIYKSFPGRITAETFKKQVLGVVEVWEDWIVFGPDFTNDLRRRLDGKEEGEEREKANEGREEQGEEKMIVSKFKAAAFGAVRDEPAIEVAKEDIDGDDIDGENIDGDDIDGEAMGGATTAGNIDGESIDGENIDGEDIDGENIDGEDIDGEDIDGQEMNKSETAEAKEEPMEMDSD